MNINFLSFLILCAVLVDLGLAVDKCYVCNGCEDPFVTQDYIGNAVKCDSNTRESCYKYITKVLIAIACLVTRQWNIM
ncbi:hypothetical protein B566_EDAN017456 [Ephemera danica]|nr:hypothetical protein B566_EDAN017456 [Ephemera danica]